jgi:hypothetical protein
MAASYSNIVRAESYTLKHRESQVLSFPYKHKWFDEVRPIKSAGAALRRISFQEEMLDRACFFKAINNRKLQFVHE